MKFTTVECPECQALHDVKTWLPWVEDIAERERHDVLRIGRALRELQALWYTLTIQSFPELGIQPDEVCREFESALTRRLGGDTEHTH